MISEPFTVKQLMAKVNGAEGDQITGNELETLLTEGMPVSGGKATKIDPIRAAAWLLANDGTRSPISEPSEPSSD